MVLPASFDTITVKGTYVDFLGNPPIDGSTIDFEPNASVMKHNASDTIIFSAKRTVTLALDGTFTIVLPVNNDPDVTPAFQYNVTENIKGASTRKYVAEFPVSAAGTTVDLSDFVVVGSVPSGTTALTVAAADTRYALKGESGGTLDVGTLNTAVNAAVASAVPSAVATAVNTTAPTAASTAVAAQLPAAIATALQTTNGIVANQADIPAGAAIGSFWVVAP